MWQPNYSVFSYIFKRNLENAFCYLIVLRGPKSLTAPGLGRQQRNGLRIAHVQPVHICSCILQLVFLPASVRLGNRVLLPPPSWQLAATLLMRSDWSENDLFAATGVPKGTMTNCPCQLLSISHLLFVVLPLSLSCNLDLGHTFCHVNERKARFSWTDCGYSKLATGRSGASPVLFWQGYRRQCSLAVKVSSEDRCLLRAWIVSAAHLKPHSEWWQG